MKKLTAIFFLFVLLFNCIGYRFLTNYLDQEAEVKMIADIDSGNYSDAELVEIKVPISLPYQTNWRDFERFHGQVELDGVHYTYVKRKIYNDSLVLLCLPNYERTMIQDAKSKFFQLVNDLNVTGGAGSTEKKAPLFTKLQLTDFLEMQHGFAIAGVLSTTYSHYCNTDEDLCCSFMPVPERPPAQG